MLQRILDYEIAVRKIIAIGLVLGIPYGIIGLIYSFNNTDHMDSLTSAGKFFSFIGQIVVWPLLIFVDLDLR